MKADPSAWMETYFDAFLYLANWGAHAFMLRLPRRVLDLDAASAYCRGESAVVRMKGDGVILEFHSDDEPGDDWDDGSGWLADLLPLRTDLAGGDHRALYLAWLLCAQSGELDADASEPPIPSGLGELTASLKAFADFLWIAEARERGNASLEVTPYTRRHTVATEMRKRGVPPRQVSGFLGHSSGYKTSKEYAKYAPRHLGQAARAADAYVAELGLAPGPSPDRAATRLDASCVRVPKAEGSQALEIVVEPDGIEPTTSTMPL